MKAILWSCWGRHEEPFYFFYSRSFSTVPTLPIYFIPNKINAVRVPTLIKGRLLTHVLYRTHLFSMRAHILKLFVSWKQNLTYEEEKSIVYLLQLHTQVTAHSRVDTDCKKPLQFLVVMNNTNHFYTLYEWFQDAEGIVSVNKEQMRKSEAPPPTQRTVHNNLLQLHKLSVHFLSELLYIWGLLFLTK